MPIFFQRPENALKRANEFIDVGKKARALDALYDVIKSKKHRTWQKIHEPIMEKYLELCVELKKSHIAKEGLYQYKNICQQVNIKSLEDVVRKYLAMAEEKTEEARGESHQAVVDVDDLEVIASPENLLLSAVSGEDTQDRTDRAILTPWVKFLWESYRQCLDLLRNNSSVEKLYQDIARDAFKFCLKYERKTEFRKLCDNLRTHLGHIHKHQHQHRAINLEDPDSQAMHLETRLVQLNSAITMELWQEAFKAVEDIHGLITKPKKQPKPSLMANYYNKLGLVFWKSGNHLFHACAWHRLFVLSLEQRKNMSQSELMKLSSRVLCATLAIPIPASRTRVDQLIELDESAQEKQRRLSTLLGMQNPPTRQQLVKDLYKLNIINNVHDDLKNLYNWLEIEFHPLKLSERVSGPLKFMAGKEDLAQYVPSLQDITITRVLKQVSQVYQTIEFNRLAKLAPFADAFRLERIIVDTARNLELQVRINHMTRVVSFGTDLGVAQKEDVPEGPYLQAMPSEHIRKQLTCMAQSLDKAVKIVRPTSVTVAREDLRKKIMQNYRQVAKSEHMRILQRRQIIEERKEELENINLQREQKEMEMVEEQRRSQYEAEMARLEKEAAERDMQRRLEEHNEIKKKAARERLDQLKSTELGAKAFADLKEEEIAGMDVDDILAKQVEQLEKEKKELSEKLKSQEKKVDYFERAKRLEEIAPLKEEYENFKIKDKEWYDQQETERIEQMKQEREIALVERDRLSLMKVDKDDFLNKLQQDRMSIYKDKLAKWQEKFEEEKKKRLRERKQRRKEERREAWIKDQQEKEQTKKDEKLKKEREEEERVMREKREEEEKEYQEKLAKLEEQEERKRQREREIEERLKSEAAASRPRDDDRGGRGGDRGGDRDEWRRGGDRDGDSRSEDRGGRSSWRPAASADTEGRSGGWRDRVKEKEDSWSKPSDDRRDDRRDEKRGEDSGAWRRGGDRDRDAAPPPARDREDGGSWRQGGGGGGRDEPKRDDDRADKGAWRSRDDGGRRDEGRRDEGRRDEGRRDDWKRGGDDKRGGESTDTWRRGGDDSRGGTGGGTGGGARWGKDRDEGRRDDRGGQEGGGGGGGSWRTGGDRGQREDRDRDRAPRDDRGGGADGGGAWRRGGDSDKPKDDGGAWRRGADRTPAPPKVEDRQDRPREGEEGWTTVQRV